MNLGLPYPPVSRQLGCVFAVVIAPLALVIALAFIMIFNDGQFLIVAKRLTVGWVRHITRTFPLITFNPMLVINGFGAAIAGGAAFHWVMSSLSQTSGSSWRVKWTVLCLSMFCILFGICVSASGLGSHLRQASLHPQFEESLTHFEIHDQTVAKIILSELPDGWQDGLVDSSLRDVPETWTYLGDTNFAVRTRLPLLCAPRAYSPRGRIVAFSDGEVKFCSEQEFEEALAHWRAERAKDLHARSIRTGGTRQ